ncbi:MAG: 3-oxoacyl-ACP reductase [Alteromonadaceae bacterium]|nr:3-oxoacyl-ACP reductase [Alteromonadaceae bacterium]
MNHSREQQAIYPGLADKVVFITGGGTGIGEVIVRQFAAQNAKVVFVDMAKEKSEALVSELAGQYQHDVTFFHCDIRDIAQLKAIITRTGDEIGRISVLINNAADDTRHSVEELSVEYWDDRFAVNLRPSFFAAQSVAPQMKQLGGGAIINMGSASWRMKQSCMPAYTTAKAAIEGLTRSLAGALGGDNIRVNTLIPGWVMTERQMSHWADPDIVEEVKKEQCLHETLRPSHIADAALFLASDQSRMMTAQTLTVDAGWT